MENIQKPYAVCYGWNVCFHCNSLREALKVAEGIEPGKFTVIRIFKKAGPPRYGWKTVREIPNLA